IDPPLRLHRIPSDISKGVLRWNGEGRSVEPFRYCGMRKMRVANPISPFVAAVSDVGDVIAVFDREVLSVAPGEDIVDLPISDDIIDEAIAGRKSLAFADGNLIKRVD